MIEAKQFVCFFLFALDSLSLCKLILSFSFMVSPRHNRSQVKLAAMALPAASAVVQIERADSKTKKERYRAIIWKQKLPAAFLKAQIEEAAEYSKAKKARYRSIIWKQKLPPALLDGVETIVGESEAEPDPEPLIQVYQQHAVPQQRSQLRARRLYLLTSRDYVSGIVRMAHDGNMYFKDEYIDYYGEEFGKYKFEHSPLGWASDTNKCLHKYKVATLQLALAMIRKRSMVAVILGRICEFWMPTYVLEDMRNYAQQRETNCDEDLASNQSVEDGSRASFPSYSRT